ncbi:hypothetical protein P0D88_01635 [Paraburkholderia sp. RL18-103-BIB-C]|jgi:hypothetical protein|uniref:hypothetical protein n=1 Tax=Paraburkholderia sp. RL18-103-BIB-C TaxID=3031637 RepID=UPI0038B7BB77
MRYFSTQDCTSPGDITTDTRLRWLSMLAFLTLAALILGPLALGDRTGLLDQDNYVQYFRETNLYWFAGLWNESQSIKLFVIRMVTDEFGWRLWVISLSTLGCSPEAGVRITVIALNVLMIYALSKTRWPLISLVLWAVIPDALATVGLFQIRQGFAFAIAMYFALGRQQPVRGAIFASLVHTTFAFPALFLILARLFARRSQFLSVTVVSGAAFTMSVMSSVLFNLYGGRRLTEYSQRVDYSLTYVIVLGLYLLIPTLFFWTRDEEAEHTASAVVTRELATMYLGILVYLIASFFVYPFGMDRIGYYSALLIPFLLPAIRVKNSLVLWAITGIFLIIGYDVFKKYLSGRYGYFL